MSIGKYMFIIVHVYVHNRPLLQKKLTAPVKIRPRSLPSTSIPWELPQNWWSDCWIPGPKWESPVHQRQQPSTNLQISTTTTTITTTAQKRIEK